MYCRLVALASRHGKGHEAKDLLLRLTCVRTHPAANLHSYLPCCLACCLPSALPTYPPPSACPTLWDLTCLPIQQRLPACPPACTQVPGQWPDRACLLVAAPSQAITVFLSSSLSLWVQV